MWKVRAADRETFIEARQIGLAGCGIAVIMLFAGFIVIYWFTGIGRKPNEFLIATDGEMKKVNWSTRREVYGSTMVVIVATFLIAAVLFVIDFGFSWVARQVGILDV